MPDTESRSCGREDIRRSCVDCGGGKCKESGTVSPPFCQTVHMDPEIKKEAMACYEEEENRKIMQTAANVEYEGYCRWCRVEETMEFAKRMGYHKLGIACCVGLIREARILTDILRAHGFEVYGIACKAGATPKTDVGIAPECCAVGTNMCNPILQAKLLESEGTEFNLVVGLCVGHDSLFYKYSQAPTTTVIVKDRVTGHNPAAALYTSHSYYKKLTE